MAQLLRSAQAQEDLLGIWMYIVDQEQSLENADRVLSEIMQIAEMLTKNPHSGSNADRYRMGLRMFPKWNYILFYEPLSDGILLHRILHGARNIEELF